MLDRPDDHICNAEILFFLNRKSDENNTSSGKNGVYILNQDGREEKEIKENGGVNTMDYVNPSFNIQDENDHGKRDSGVQADLPE